MMEKIAPLCSTLTSPHPEWYIQFWGPQIKKVIVVREQVQTRESELVKSLEVVSGPREIKSGEGKASHL